jgi:hypothetical protein
MAGALVAGSFDAVGVVAGSFDDPRVGPVAAFRVEVAPACDVGPEGSEGVLMLVRGESPPDR